MINLNRNVKDNDTVMSNQLFSPPFHAYCRKSRSFLFMLLLVTIFFSGGQTVVAAEEAIKPPSGEDMTEKTLNRDEILKQLFGGQDLFFYHRENRPDPFLPFIREKVLQQKTGEEVVEEELTGLRKFEPGQLTLVAIVFKGKIPMAMVQDPVGLGYILGEGTKIGRYGTVEEITPSAVIVQQTTRTWDQEKLFKRVEMVLPKEGEK
jgi:hypothetical protein